MKKQCDYLRLCTYFLQLKYEVVDLVINLAWTQTACYNQRKMFDNVFRAQKFFSQSICSGFENANEIYDDGNILIHPYNVFFYFLGFLMVLLVVAVKIGRSRLTLKTPKSGIGIPAPKNLESIGLNLTLVVILAVSFPCRVYLNK